jgi:hypothetical protein
MSRESVHHGTAYGEMVAASNMRRRTHCRAIASMSLHFLLTSAKPCIVIYSRLSFGFVLSTSCPCITA